MIPSHPTPLSWTHPESGIEHSAHVAAHLEGYELRTLLGERSRRRSLVVIRHRVWSRLRSEGYSFPEIAELFEVHHSSVLNACKKRNPPRVSGRIETT